ncbi:hypothetical protein Hanom_Chr07g00659501 [Helianthus anomalus]
MTSITIFIYDYLMYMFCCRMSSSRMDTTSFQLEKLLEDVIESDRLLFEKLNDLTARGSSIREKQTELQVSIDALYAR